MGDFMLFCGDLYYPSAGQGDYKGRFSSKEDALNYLEGIEDYDWWAIYDIRDDYWCGG